MIKVELSYGLNALENSKGEGRGLGWSPHCFFMLVSYDAMASAIKTLLFLLLFYFWLCSLLRLLWFWIELSFY